MTASICILLATLPLGQSKDQVRNSDGDVIELALLSFYGETGKLIPEWNKGTFVVVTSKFSSDVRPDFDAYRLKMWEWANGRKKHEQARLLSSLKNIKGTGFKPGELLPLKGMQLDERIVLWDRESSRRRFSGEITVKSRAGKKGTGRAWAWVHPPTYSPDGRYAIVSMGVPWSIHHADLNFLLSKQGGGWTIECVQDTFYV